LLTILRLAAPIALALFNMSSPSTVRSRSEKPKKKGDAPLNGAVDTVSDVAVKAKEQVKAAAGSEWDYKVALTIITILAFVSRFWGISHPDQVVFDEVHFGKVRKL
jgi:dolichyl-phosphate-mannose-protein mannosyltransferase